MDFQIPITIPSPAQRVSYGDKILLMGSCFTDHIGEKLKTLKFDTLQNPNGILFDPISVAGSLSSYIHPRPAEDSDLFYLNELWRSWKHHGIYSGVDKNELLGRINQSQLDAHRFLKNAGWLIISVGTAFSYSLSAAALSANASSSPGPVANCHRAPGNWFTKKLLPIEEIESVFDGCFHALFQFNPSIKVLFTVSPVRHIRDGVIENNRSKARLLEAVHRLVDRIKGLYYFPAYELVIDILRDYRFYDLDMVHPNYQATAYVFEKFAEYFIDKVSRQLMEEVSRIVSARRHQPFQPMTNAHRQFLQAHYELTKELKSKYPGLDLEEELAYFSEGFKILNSP
jgi:hypothetical protein